VLYKLSNIHTYVDTYISLLGFNILNFLRTQLYALHNNGNNIKLCRREQKPCTLPLTLALKVKGQMSLKYNHFYQAP